MKIWFRINGLEFCSWFIVFKHLMKGFRQTTATVPDSPFAPPKGVADFVEFHWADPAFWNWSDEKVKLKAGLALSEHRSLLRPADAYANLQKCEVLLCPCLSAAQAFQEAPIDIPIEIAPFGVDAKTLKYHKRDWENGVFKFLLIGVAQFRKGSWLALEAFRNAFTDSKDVSLTVASFRESPMFLRLKQDFSQYDNIRFHGKEEDVRDLYHTNHVLVSPQLSEGWGLTIPEAGATGMPCIVARCSAPREYFSPEFGWWIEMSELYAPVEQCLAGVRGSWRLPSVDDLTAKMRHAFEHRDECQDKGKVASDHVLNNMTWKQSAQRVIDIFEKYIGDKR